LARARALNIPVIRRADALGELVSGGGARLVAVAGTHGKTTTTVMTTEALSAAGRNPTGLAGGRVASWGGNARIGGDELYVVEADEYDKAFLSLRPTVAIVNNVEADHLECYGSVEALEATFVEFADRAQRVIIGADDVGADRVALQLQAPVWRVGLGPTADVRIRAVRLEPGGSRATILMPGGHLVELQLAVLGMHNVRNAAAALAALHALGADVLAGAQALSAFHGVGRRFERLGEERGVTVVDDYAHHPTEVAATLSSARQAYPGRRVVAVFQPHLYSRTALHGEALGKALGAADVVIVAPIYGAREGRSASRITSWCAARPARAPRRSRCAIAAGSRFMSRARCATAMSCSPWEPAM
jgi:UDP-N-acetylmuramate--alanine ligase